jgi:RCC1 and BTB domain-containing protein
MGQFAMALAILKVQVGAGFLHDMKEMVNDDEYSDVTFIVDGQPVYAHRAVLAKRCDHFAAMFRSGMRESEAYDLIANYLS